MNRLKSFYIFTAAIFLFLSSSVSLARIRLNGLFSDNMVLQQNRQVKIWGDASPSCEVVLRTSWDNVLYKTKSDDAGKWEIEVCTGKAGGPYTISISDGDSLLVLENVLLGEVWLCGGQSNMEMKMNSPVDGYEKEREEAAIHKTIRLLHVHNTMNPFPEEEVGVWYDGWQECSAEVIKDFSAAGYFFGQKLNAALDCPIGLIESCQGATYAEAWVSASSLEQMPDFATKLARIKQLPMSKEDREELFKEDLREWDAEIVAADTVFDDGSLLYGDYDDSGWEELNAPSYVTNGIVADFDGIIWARKVIVIPREWEGRELILNLACIDDHDFTYFNGVLLGHVEGCWIRREYRVPPELVKAGRTTIAVRILDNGGSAGFSGERDWMTIGPSETELISLAGPWKYKESLSLSKIPAMPVNTAKDGNYPSFLFNSMINPLRRFQIQGAIWYQGESNTSRAEQYSLLLPLLINDWRQAWGYDFPFYVVQLANYKRKQSGPEDSDWARLREAQLKTSRAMENVALAVAIDIGEADDIHPKNKGELGHRLSLLALAGTYGRNITASGPLYESYQIEGDRISLLFSHTDNGMLARGDTLEGFYIAGCDKVFHKAVATICGDRIVVSSPEVCFPVAVRYGWADNPYCNLYNTAGLPASPFRTDTWDR